MELKPLTSEKIALTEKKMNMTLDDIIKMAKTKTTKPKPKRVSNKSPNFSKHAFQDKSTKMWKFMESKSSLRQGVLAQRRSNFQPNQFPLAVEAARKASVAPTYSRTFNHSRPPNANKLRVGSQLGQRRAANGGFAVKQPQQSAKAVPKQKPQTLDSRFATMKEQRMRAQSQRNNDGRQNGGGQRSQQWGRRRFAN